MFRATWHAVVLAESDRTVKLEGNHYFPADSLHWEFFTDSTTSSTCPWKGQARYYNVRVDGTVNRDAAWYYPNPSQGAQQIAGHVAFWHGSAWSGPPGPAASPRRTATAWPAASARGCPAPGAGRDS